VKNNYDKSNALSNRLIGAAIEVHRKMGASLIESIYEKCLMRELALQKIPAKNQVLIPIEYKGYTFEEPLRLDILVDDCLLVELKSVQKVLPIHKAQLLSYMKLLKTPLGLLLNFHEIRLSNGIHRMILPGTNR